jgi:hypothetical protein
MNIIPITLNTFCLWLFTIARNKLSFSDECSMKGTGCINIFNTPIQNGFDDGILLVLFKILSLATAFINASWSRDCSSLSHYIKKSYIKNGILINKITSLLQQDAGL